MYNGIKSSIYFNGLNSPVFAGDLAVRQGANLSPVLFALYLNDFQSYLLHKNLNGITTDITTKGLRLYLKLFSLFYADDTVLMANNPDDLQNCLRAFAEYSTGQGFFHQSACPRLVIIFAPPRDPALPSAHSPPTTVFFPTAIFRRSTAERSSYLYNHAVGSPGVDDENI